MTHVRLILTLAYCLLLAPLAVCWGLWAFFALLALLPSPARMPRDGAGRGGTPIDILIPAHDEELLLPRLLESLAGQSAAGTARRGRLLVIADHCSDATATLARQAGADVLERSSGPRGKPAALRDGLALLASGPSDRAVLILDADCTVSPNLLEALAAALDACAPVAQAAYLCDVAPRAGSQGGETPCC
mgnify:FL=1